MERLRHLVHLQPAAAVKFGASDDPQLTTLTAASPPPTTHTQATPRLTTLPSR